MRSREELEGALEEVLRRGYYAEDFELFGTLQQFATSLDPNEREIFEKVILCRLSEEPSIVNVMLCSVVRMPEAVAVLTGILNAQTRTSQLTRYLITVLGHYGASSAFSSIERFLDSDQEGEALTALAAIDFRRALFHVLRNARRGRLLDHGLQILHERRKTVGFETLGQELAAQKVLLEDVPAAVRLLLRVREGRFNPFSDEEQRRLLARLAAD